MMTDMSSIKGNPHLEVITGGMFSGKSMEIARRLTNIYYYNKHNPDKEIKFLIIRPMTDTRSEEDRPVPYNRFEQMMVDSQWSDRVGYMLQMKLLAYDVIVFDEAQFLSEGFCGLIDWLINQNKNIIVCGLDKDYRMRPFSEFMKYCLACADDVVKLHAICAVCGKPSDGAKLVLVGDKKIENDSNILIEDENHKYIPMCRKCMRT